MTSSQGSASGSAPDCTGGGSSKGAARPSELEWLGFELALGRYFGLPRVPGAIVTRLVRRGGSTCSADDLAAITGSSVEALRVHIFNLRDAMSDLGFGRIENVRGLGYRLSQKAADEVWQRVFEVVFHLPEGQPPKIAREAA